jgi:hypothetical protein
MEEKKRKGSAGAGGGLRGDADRRKARGQRGGSGRSGDDDDNGSRAAAWMIIGCALGAGFGALSTAGIATCMSIGMLLGLAAGSLDRGDGGDDDDKDGQK